MAKRPHERDDDDEPEGKTRARADARHPEIEHPSTGLPPDPLPIGFKQEDAWPPRSGAVADPRMMRETVRQEKQQRDQEADTASKSNEQMSKFIEQFVADMPPEVQIDNKFIVPPDQPVDTGDVADGWYADRGWAFEVKEGKLVQALGPGAPNRPTRFVAV